MFYLLANGVFAMRYPGRRLQSRWTATRGIKPDASPDRIRMNGVINTAIFGIVFDQRSQSGSCHTLDGSFPHLEASRRLSLHTWNSQK
jgi:hypothetical protein